MAVQTATSRVLLGTAVGATATAGTVVGAVVATARDVKRVKDGDMTRAEAVADVGKEAVGTGLSAATGVAVVGALGIGGLLGLVGIVGVASGAKYLWDKQFGYKPKPKQIGCKPGLEVGEKS